MINLNYDDIQEFGDIADGTYEAVITKIEEKKANSGTKLLNFWLTIRKDFEQKHKGQIIFHTVWASKDTGEYRLNDVLILARAAGLPKGANYSSWNAIFQALDGKSLKVTVKSELNTYKNDGSHELKVKKLEQSNLTPIDAGTTLDINDADLPF